MPAGTGLRQLIEGRTRSRNFVATCNYPRKPADGHKIYPYLLRSLAKTGR
jgi:hypothetical protein